MTLNVSYDAAYGGNEGPFFLNIIQYQVTVVFFLTAGKFDRQYPPFL